ncbi:RDD family protein [Pedobacter sp. KR3-3]|uniref:RDD family protein n=1 Tax=Pedobacter albus TaxID=3113905 RepID=A0ABU7I2L9_9SPHI|nr:RDD family protein [Pedobacter sp. KR3-3]MEE1943639.1 RDD family protein [Pedobacter sp. KR3-3]
MRTRITLLCLVTAVFGILADVGVHLPSFPLSWIIENLLVAFDFYSTVRAIRDIPITSLINLMLLIGAFVYLAYKGKETRLLGFSFAVILGYRLSLFIGNLPKLFYQFNLSTIVLMLGHVLWVWIAIRMLSYFNQQKTLKTEQSEKYDENYYVAASAGQRLFNFLIDTIVALLLLFALFSYLLKIEWVKQAALSLSDLLGERMGFFFIAGLFRFVYYLGFELAFQTSAGKLLTGTRVIKNEGNKLDFKTTFLRTLCRYIPFEPFSFAFSRTGWHDRWSDTSVVKEEKAVAKPGLYFLLIPLLIVFMVGLQFFAHQIRSYRMAKAYTDRIEREQNELIDELSNLETSDFIKATSNADYYSTVYLKPEKIEASQITFTAIKVNPEGVERKEKIEAFYLKNKDTLPRITLSKKELIEAVKGDKDQIKGIRLPEMGFYKINGVSHHFQPDLSPIIQHPYQRKYVIVNIRNFGIPATILKIENDGSESNIKWEIDRPQLGNYLSSAQGTILGRSENPIGDFKIRLYVSDSLNVTRIYSLSSTDEGNRLKRIKP